MTTLSQAHYRGVCPNCGAPINIGDWLHYRGDAMTCRLCPPATEVPERPAPTEEILRRAER